MIRILVMSVVANFLLPTLIHAQNVKSDLVLKVCKESGKPLSKATVNILKDGRLWIINIPRSTNSNGTMTIHGLDSGSYTIFVYHGSKNLETELIVKPGHNEVYLEMNRKRLPLLTVEVQPALISDSYGGSVSSRKTISISHGPQFLKPDYRSWDSPTIGGLWHSDTRAPTFRNMMNMQPND